MMPENERKASLLLIYTGGTIGMVKSPVTQSLVPMDFSNISDKVPELKMLNSVYSVLFFATFSYVFSLIANWLVGLFIKKDAK